MKRILPWRLVTGSFAFVSLAVVFSGSLAWADNGPQHRVWQHRPIELGTSGGSINDVSGGFAFGGTLGALVVDAKGVQCVLGNNHVLARTNAAPGGEGILQPSLIDQDYVGFQDRRDIVARLAKFVGLKFLADKSSAVNTVDAAIAVVSNGYVWSDGSILDIGVPSASTRMPYVGLSVKKSGRTTGLSFGTVTAINVTMDVVYEGNRTARFINQIRITPGTFSSGGDSGALVVENVATNPRAVGLLFAGGSGSTLANPINDVLNAFRVRMVGEGSAKPQDEKAGPDVFAYAGPVKQRYDPMLMGKPGVVGTGLSLDARGRPVIEIYTIDGKAGAAAPLPAALDGVPTRVVVTGPFMAF